MTHYGKLKQDKRFARTVGASARLCLGGTIVRIGGKLTLGSQSYLLVRLKGEDVHRAVLRDHVAELSPLELLAREAK